MEKIFFFMHSAGFEPWLMGFCNNRYVDQATQAPIALSET